MTDKTTTGSDAVDLDKSRAEFEAWAIDNEFDIAKYSDGEYCSDLNRYWLGWQAALIAQARAADAQDAQRYRYVRATTTAIREPETGERIECTPELFDQAIDKAIDRAAMAATKEKK